MDSATSLSDRQAPPAPGAKCSRQRLSLADGAAAELEGTAPLESLRFFAPGGRLLFEYDARSGKARVTVEEGDLEVDTGPGDLVLRGDRRVRIEGESVEIAGTHFGVTAGLGDVRLGETRFAGEKLRGWIGEARLTLRRFETLAGTVVRKARDVYDSVEGLTQHRTGRLRTLIKGTWHARSRDTVLTAERDVSIDGEEIHLG